MNEQTNESLPELELFSQSSNILVQFNIPTNHKNDIEKHQENSLESEDDDITKKSFCKTHVCEKCQRHFKQKTRYDRHVANHPSEKNYLCSTCNKTFTRMAHLEKHLRTHTDERRHVCHICGAAFILSHHLVRHNLVHTGIRPFECSICKKQFTRKAGLTQHLYIHNGERPFNCDFENCGKSFSDRTTLRRHFLTHFCEKPFICKECEKTFKTKSACRKHYIKHFRPSSSFKCGICEEMFKSEDLLADHIPTHDLKRVNKNFRCGFCMRVFKSQVDLELHVPQHDSGLVYECSYCHLKFYTKNDLNNHITQQSHYLHNQNSDSVETSKKESDISTLCNGKVVIVLQLPSASPATCIKGDGETLQINDIHHLLDSTQLDKLLVTTNSLTTPSLSLQLSEDQQQGVQEILQGASVKYLLPPHSNISSAPIHRMFSEEQIEDKKSFSDKTNDEKDYIIINDQLKNSLRTVEIINCDGFNKKVNDSVFRSSKSHIEPQSGILFSDPGVRIDIQDSGKFISIDSNDLIDTSFEKLPKSAFQSPFEDIALE